MSARRNALAVLCLVLLSGACLAAVTEQAYEQLLVTSQADPVGAFEEFARLHNKAYLSDRQELARRQEVFQANVAKIAAHNARNDASYTLGLNAHADLTTEEFRLRYFGAKPSDLLELRATAASVNGDSKGDPFPYRGEVPPPRRNWVEEGKITPVKDQHVGGAPCGCCYAFGGVAGVEAANALFTGELTTLSEQEVVDCDLLDYGCDGGDFTNVFRWIKENGGIDSDADWPYAAKEMRCHHKQAKRSKAVKIDGHVDVPERNETALTQSVSHTPTVVAVCCGDYIAEWHLYKSGIMDEAMSCVEPLDHSVLVVGYDTDAATGTDYWLVKNSWGAHWGEAGFFRMKRNVADKEGQGGLATMPGYAYKTKPNPGQEVRRMGMRGSVQGLVDTWQDWRGWLSSS